MSIKEKISTRIKYMPKGKPFSIDYFNVEGSRASIDKALSRLAESGQLERVTRGVYMRPKISEYAGKIQPSALSVIEVLAKRNREVVQVHGAEAVRILSLSTQMQTRLVLYTSGSSREITIGASTVSLRHAAPVKLQHAGTRVGLALSALFYLGQAGVDRDTIAIIKNKLTANEYKQLVNSKMPVWMKNVIEPGNSDGLFCFRRAGSKRNLKHCSNTNGVDGKGGGKRHLALSGAS